jgi:hypothetical protein
MPDPVGKSSLNPYMTAEPDTCSELDRVATPTSPEVSFSACPDTSSSAAVESLTSKYKVDLSGFWASQAGSASASPAAPVPNQKLEESKRVTQYAELANAAYDSNVSVPGWHRLEPAELAAAGLDPKDFEDPETGFKAAMFQNEETNEFVLAFAGTEMKDPGDWTDWKANLNQGLGNLEPQYRQAAQLSVAVTDAVGTTTMVGHSLGGGLASAASLASRSEGVTFNAAGLHANTLDYARTAVEPQPAPLERPTVVGLVVDRLTENTAHRETDLHITNYRVEGEVLSSMQDLLPVPEAQGKQVDLRPAQQLNPLELHYGAPVIDALRGREYRLSE